MRRNDSFDEGWFDASPTARLDIASTPPRGDSAHPAFDPLRSGLLASLGGSLGGLVALATADGAAHSHRLAGHVRVALDQAPALGSVNATTVREWIGVTALTGALLGGGFGALMRRLVPVVPRVLFSAILSSALCTLLYAFVLLRLAPTLAGRIPFLSCMLAALAYGACIGLVPPVRRIPRFDDGEATTSPPLGTPPLPDSLGSTQLAEHRSFPLVRKRPQVWDRL